jgi:hypothetical protein
MRPGKRLIAMVVAATAGLALYGCGDAEHTGAVKPGLASAGTKSGLGTARYRALDAIAVATVPFDRFRSTAVDAATLAAAGQHLRAACDALDMRDGLLRWLKRACGLQLNFNQATVVFVTECLGGHTGTQGPLFFGRACLGSIQRISTLLPRIRRVSRQGDRAVRRSALTPACRQTLITSALSYAIDDAYSRAFALLARGARTRSRRDLEVGQRLLGAADTKNQDLPSAQQQLSEFRSGCA